MKNVTVHALVRRLPFKERVRKKINAMNEDAVIAFFCSVSIMSLFFFGFCMVSIKALFIMLATMLFLVSFLFNTAGLMGPPLFGNSLKGAMKFYGVVMLIDIMVLSAIGAGYFVKMSCYNMLGW